MKLLVVSHTLNIESNVSVFRNLEEKFDWHLVYVKPSLWKSEYTPQSSSRNDKTYSVRTFLSGSIPLHFYSIKLLSIIIRERPDIIYSHNEPYSLSTFQVFLFSLLARIKVLSFYSAQNIKKNYPPPFRWIEKFIYRNSSSAISITQEVAEVLIEKGYRKNIDIVPLSADHERFLPKNKSNFRVKVGYVGRFVKEKGLLDLIDGLGKVVSQKWQLELYGTGPLEDEMRNRIAALGLEEQIKFNGFVSHESMPGEMADLDILILPSVTTPSWKEQFGRVLVEAALSNVAVMGSSSGEIPILVKELGGVVFKEGDSSDLARKLERLIDDAPYRNKTALSNRENAMLKFTDVKTASILSDALQRLLIEDQKKQGYR